MGILYLVSLRFEILNQYQCHWSLCSVAQQFVTEMCETVFSQRANILYRANRCSIVATCIIHVIFIYKKWLLHRRYWFGHYANPASNQNAAKKYKTLLQRCIVLYKVMSLYACFYWTEFLLGIVLCHGLFTIIYVYHVTIFAVKHETAWL